MTGLTLATITEQYAQALAPIIAGEFNPDDPDEAAMLEEALDNFEQAGLRLRDKAQSYAQVIHDFEGDLRKIDFEIAYFEALKLRRQRHIEWLKERLMQAMQVAEVDRFEGGLYTIRIQQKPPKTDVLEQMLVPAEFLRHIPEVVTPERWEVNKVAVNKHFTATGEVPPGVTVTRGQKLVIS